MQNTEAVAELAAALEMKNRLVDYNANSTARTRVFDDAADWYSESVNPWLSQ